MLHFGRLNKVKEGKLEKIKSWLTTLNTVRRDEAIATFEYEGVSREAFVLFKGNDGNHYVLGLNEASDIPKKGDPSVPINQEHWVVKQECLEAVSDIGEVLLDLSAEE